jgi:hypothetical protein
LLYLLTMYHPSESLISYCTTCIVLPSRALIHYIMDYRASHPEGYRNEKQWRPLCDRIWRTQCVPTVYLHRFIRERHREERRSVFDCTVGIEDNEALFRCDSSSKIYDSTFSHFILADINGKGHYSLSYNPFIDKTV